MFNSEQYIHRCVSSILNQTYTDWELLLIDDGSTDNSLLILKEYEIKDHRIKVFHQTNKGPGSARNLGIKNSQGEYVVFIDSDDYISDSYFELLSHHDTDVVFIDVDQIDEHGQLIKKEYMSEYQNMKKDDLIRYQLTGRIPWGGVRKAVKRSLIISNNIVFSNLAIGEEALYSFKVLLYSGSYSFIGQPVYYYYNRSGSQSDQYNEDPWGPMTLFVRDSFIRLNIYNDYSSTINALMVTAAIISLDRLARTSSRAVFIQKAKKRMNQLRSELDSKYVIDFNHIMPKALLMYLCIRLHLYTVFYYVSNLNNYLKNRE